MRKKINSLVNDPNIIRHKGKIASAVKNTQIFIEIQKEFGSFYNHLYTLMPHHCPIINSLTTSKDEKTSRSESDAISKDLKRRGIKFFGTTICYAYMQAGGMVNDHIDSCSFKETK